MHRLALLLAISAAACVDQNPDDVVSIDRGVYGLTISGCDTSGCEDERYEHALVYATPIGTTDTVTVQSDGDGFFEIALPPGTYELCVFSCTTVTIADGERVRRDFISGPGGGIWCQDGVCGPGE
jgi:hypothetical protein